MKSKTDAIQWLMEVDALLGAGFHCDNPAEEYDVPLPLDFDFNRREYFKLAEREGFDPYQFAMDMMPSFQALGLGSAGQAGEQYA